jgi:predicted transcriptional regulator
MDADLDDGLERMARKQRRSKSDLIREAVRGMIKPLPPLEDDPVWKMAGMASFEPVEDIDEFLYG